LAVPEVEIQQPRIQRLREERRQLLGDYGMRTLELSMRKAD